jgi:hypothetical protein
MSLLTPVEREAINDSVLKIQSIQASLSEVRGGKIPSLDQIHECLTTAHGKLQSVLRGEPYRQPKR